LRAWIALFALGCGPKSPPASLPTGPILPAPEAGLYAVAVGVPADSLVAAVVEEGVLPWDEALSGAAGAVALDRDRRPDLSWARWAARRAGYPHPIVSMFEGNETADVLPAALASAAQSQLQMGDHIGVARARGPSGDRWVVLVGRPQVLLDPLPRVVDTGQPVSVIPDRPAAGFILAPDGERRIVPLPGPFTPDQVGEWWVALHAPGNPDDVWASFPIYAGVMPSPVAPLGLPGIDVVGKADARGEALDVLVELRAHYEVATLESDRTLDTLAELPLSQVLEGTWERAKGEARLAGAGYVGGPLAQVWCRASTVAACVDDLATRPGTRQVILDRRMRVVGVAAQTDTSGVTMVVNLASE
jgi:hypothetical protein